jgi:hypothetical protein
VSYQPQPGTIAFRAIEWLKRQPTGSEYTASMWAEAIGNCDGESLLMCLKPALHCGIIKRRTKHGMQRPFWFSLGDGTPPMRELPEDEDDRDPLPVRRTVKPATEAPLHIPSFVDTLAQHYRLDSAISPAAGQSQAEAVAEESAGDDVGHAEPGPEPGPEPEHAGPTALFEAWLSAMSGELVLCGVAVNEDGDPVLTREQVHAVRQLLAGGAQ